MILLVGSGNMAIEYAKVLVAQKKNFIVVGRSKTGAKRFTDITGLKCADGGLEKYLNESESTFSHAIVATNVTSLYENSLLLLNHGIKKILIEKPGALNLKEFIDLRTLATEKKANVFIGYNRRFYASVIALKELISSNKSISAEMELTEWVHEFKSLNKSPKEMNKLFLTNTTHVVDTCFYLIGSPKEISSKVSGGLDWHKSGSIFIGTGITKDKNFFSYHGNWGSGGRWSIKLYTPQKKYLLEPLEKLSFIKLGTVNVQEVQNIDYTLDLKFKPGIYLQTESFLSDRTKNLCTVEEQLNSYKFYQKMAGYVE